MSKPRFKVGPDGEGAWVIYDTEMPAEVAYYEKIENALKNCRELNEEFSPKRTFEEIINELIEKPEIKATFPVLRKYKNGEVDLANHKDDRTITIWPNGDTNFLGLTELTAAQLAAISDACTEIAANYEAEHGKEDTCHD